MVEGEWAGRVTGLGNQRVEIAMLVTPDGHSRLELSRFLTPAVVADHRRAPANALGYLRIMFAVEDLDDTLARLRKRGAELVGEWSSTKTPIGRDIRGPEGILIGLAQQLNRADFLGRTHEPRAKTEAFAASLAAYCRPVEPVVSAAVVAADIRAATGNPDQIVYKG